MKEKVLVFLPVYNEKQYVKPVINTITETLKKLEEETKRGYDILAVNDSSDAELINMLRDIAKENTRLSIANHGVNKGLAQAIKTGWKYFLDNNYDYIIRTDCDFEQPHADVITKLDRADDVYDVVVARRHNIKFPKGSIEEKTTYERTVQINELFDTQFVEPSSGNHKTHREIAGRVAETDYYKNYSRRWALDTVIVVLAKLLGGNIGYVDVEGRNQPERRPDDKVLLQDSIRKEVIAELYNLKV